MRSSVVLSPPVAHTNTTHAHTLSLLSQALQRKCQRHREMESLAATSAHPLSSFVPVTSNSDSPLCPTSFDFIGLVCPVCIFAFN